MADKSLFDIAKELYQGFGNNPANRELANTLTFRAPVVRELNPIVTVPRGIEALRNTDYGAIKDFLTGKYQISDDPKASLQRSGQAAMNLTEGALDAAPVLGLIKPTIAGAKMAAPHLAEAGVRQLNRLEEKYGLPTSPVMNIIKPQGNLNFTTRLDEQIRGPETQTVFDLLKQVQGKPGVTKEGLKKLAQNYPDTAAKISKQEFKENIPASYYRKEDLAGDSETVFNNYLEEAMEGGLDQAQTYHNLGIPESLHSSLDDLLSNELYFDDLDPQQQQDLRRLFGVPEHATDDDAFEDIIFRIDEQQREEAYEYAMDRVGGSQENGYSYKDFQRLVGQDEPGYFEFGVTHPEQMMKESTGQAKRYKHYSNESMPGGLIGHVRGTHLDSPATVQGGFDVPANSYVIEEIQSDAQKGVEQTGALHQAHGTLFKAAVQDALEKGADRIYLPTSHTIGSARGKSGEDYASIYDNAVIKEGLDPLSKIPGVEVKTITHRILNGMLEFEDVPWYREITISPEAREHILSGPGQSVPGYAAGGLVASDYDEEHIDRMSDEIMNFGKGGLFKAIGKLVEPTAQVVKKAPETHPFIGYMTKDGKMEKFNELQAKEADYHHSNLVKNLDAYDSDDSLKFVRNGSENVYSIRGNAAITPHSTASKEQLSRLAKRLVNEGADPSAPFSIEHMSLPETEAPYQGKSIGTLKQWIEGTHGFAKGGKVTGQPHENEYVKAAGKLSRKTQGMAASLIPGLRPILDKAQDLPLKYYAATGEHNGEADAMRHMLLQAQLMQKYGETPAKAIGWLHENISFGQPEREQAMDEYNDILGREIGAKAKSEKQMIDMARQYIDSKKAKSLAQDNAPDGYAQGGLVYNDEEINNLADQLLGA